MSRPKGFHVSEETKRKIGDAQRGAKNHLFGKVGPNKGHRMSEEQKIKISISLKNSDKTNKGKKFSEDHRKRISEALKGHPVSDEARKKMSINHKGVSDGVRKFHAENPDFFRGERNPNYGKHHSDEIRKTISEKTLKRFQIKENHPRWRGGVSFEPYCPKFTPEFKERVRAFFNYTCQTCGHLWQKGENRLSVHHVNFNKMSCCNDVIPLFVPLCQSCHTKTNTNREYWEEVFTNKILLEHDGECYIPRSN